MRRTRRKDGLLRLEVLPARGQGDLSTNGLARSMQDFHACFPILVRRCSFCGGVPGLCLLYFQQPGGGKGTEGPRTVVASKHLRCWLT